MVGAELTGREGPRAVSCCGNRAYLHAFVALVALLLPGGACKQGAAAKGAPSAEAALEATRVAARAEPPAALWDTLDQPTRWSAMSAYRAQLESRRLVQKHYPAKRRAAELRRTQMAGNASDARAFFDALIAGQGNKLLGPLRSLRASGRRAAGSRCVLFSQGAHDTQRFCQDKAGRWHYSGLRGHFEQIKLRSTRDLETVREGVTVQGGG